MRHDPPGVEWTARPRFGKGGRVFTPNATKLAEARVIAAWQDAGEPRLPDGPVVLELTLRCSRPKDHHTSKGALSAKGLRERYPTGRKPDVDNALKLVMDALNGRAYRDDVNVVDASVRRVWSADGWESSMVVVSSLAPSVEVGRAA
jgi:Holliday junction resolvase RusA-like endonuclease